MSTLFLMSLISVVSLVLGGLLGYLVKIGEVRSISEAVDSYKRDVDVLRIQYESQCERVKETVLSEAAVEIQDMKKQFDSELCHETTVRVVERAYELINECLLRGNINDTEMNLVDALSDHDAAGCPNLDPLLSMIYNESTGTLN